MAEQSFEIPAEAREFMEKSIEQARSAFEAFTGAAQKAASSVESALPGAAKEVNSKIFACAQTNIDATFDFAKKLAQAKDVQEIMQLHADFAKAQTESLQKQATEVAAAVQKAMSDATGKSSQIS